MSGDAYQADRGTRSMLRRLPLVVEVANAATLLASDRASAMTAMNANVTKFIVTANKGLPLRGAGGDAPLPTGLIRSLRMCVRSHGRCGDCRPFVSMGLLERAIGNAHHYRLTYDALSGATSVRRSTLSETFVRRKISRLSERG
jgi:hypothetical protein